MSKTNYFINNFTYSFILRPTEAFGNLIRSYFPYIFKRTQIMAQNDEYFDRTEAGFKTWLNSLDAKPKIKPLLQSPLHHSEFQARSRGGKFSKNNNS